MRGISGDAVKVSQEQLQKVLLALLGKESQVTVREHRAFVDLLPKHHWAISPDAWRAAAEAEGLQIEEERTVPSASGLTCWAGLTIWRRGAKKQPVLIVPRSQPAAAVAPLAPLDPEKVAEAARALVEREAADGRVMTIAAAVEQLAAGRSWGPSARSTPEARAPQAHQDDPTEAARLAQAIVDAEARAGRACSLSEAMERVVAPQDDPQARGRRIRDHVTAEGLGGRTISFTKAAEELGFRW